MTKRRSVSHGWIEFPVCDGQIGLTGPIKWVLHDDTLSKSELVKKGFLDRYKYYHPNDTGTSVVQSGEMPNDGDIFCWRRNDTENRYSVRSNMLIPR